jgi:translation elongation factor EF-1beta
VCAAKTAIVLDIKPWDDETDLNAMEQKIRSIEADGLLWGQCK